MTPDRLRQLASELDDRARASLEAGDVDAAVRACELAERYRVAAETLATRCHGGFNAAASPTARLHMSKSHRPRTALHEACVTHGFSIGSLIAKLRSEGHRITKQNLVVAHSGGRRVRREVAQRIEEIVDLEATPKNWPGGWSK